MEKIERSFNVDYQLDWSYAEIKKIREDIDQIEKLGATHVDIDYGDGYLYINPIVVRLETDKELKKRIDDDKNRQESVKRHELSLLEALKKKYENG